MLNLEKSENPNLALKILKLKVNKDIKGGLKNKIFIVKENSTILGIVCVMNQKYETWFQDFDSKKHFFSNFNFQTQNIMKAA